jgi:hypothetical protein
MTLVGVLAAVAVIILSTVRASWSAQQSHVGSTGSSSQALRVYRWAEVALGVVAIACLLPRLFDLLT